MKYIVWINEDKGAGWEENGDGPLTYRQAERIAREIFMGCHVRTKFLPVGRVPVMDKTVAIDRDGNRHVD
jgi:hypothetical protein